MISFEEKTIQPLLNAHPWFSAGNYGIDCEFKENGAIVLLIYYCPNRYEKIENVKNVIEFDIFMPYTIYSVRYYALL